MEGGHMLVLVLSVLLIYVQMEAVTTFGSTQSHNHHHQQKLSRTRRNPGFISIDCGATEDYYDESSGIFYKTDEGFIDTGSGKVGQISSVYNTAKGPLSSLRSFPTETKNCYTLKPEQGKNNKYLIRATFLYGNYDEKNQPPTFDVYIGVNLWVTMEVTNSSGVDWFEGIHLPLTDNINVCLVNIGKGTPFISTLELRPVDSSIYHIGSSSELLHLTRRYDVGSSADINKRYKDDVYDRNWQPLQLPDRENFKSWYLINISSTTDIQSSNDTYKPPAEVLRNAAQTLNASTPLNFYLTPPDANYEHCIYFHFAEILEAKNGQLRKQYVSSNGVNLSTPVTLDYLKPMTIGPLNLTISEGRLKFSVYATEDSDLPPILNAFEIFRIHKLLNSPTHPDDADAMMDIKQKYWVTSNWQGDPCVPRFVSWKALECSNDSPRRIISLNLYSRGLAGNIATSISNLTSLQSLDLSYNMLTGPVPEFLAQLPFLKVLDLTGNKLTGSIPQALREKSNSGTLQLSIDRNPDLCLSAPCKPKENNFIIPVVASITSFLVVLIIALALWWKCRRQGDMSIGSRRSLMSKNQEFTYSEVVSITDNFRTVIGEGGFGKVYLGTLKNGDLVAVKLRSSSSKQGLNEFRSEALLLMRVHHGNLISLIGFCDDGKNMVLVYEYMANGDLRQHLSETSSNVLNWSERLQVARDAAQGLEYLHNGCKPPIIHRDVKTANILLNKDYQGKIADFGLSRDSVHTTNPAGTIAYMDPEAMASRKLNKKSDVYSFGVVLLELITGQPALRSPDMIHIVHWIRPFIERGDIRSIVDPRLQGKFNPNSAWKAVEVAMSCIPPAAIQRPEMSDVLSELKECLAIEMACHRSWSRKSNERSLSNSLELATMNLDTDITPSAR